MDAEVAAALELDSIMGTTASLTIASEEPCEAIGNAL